jgi:phospho-N-acetylmuramoyl-pentapeptide-transferase
MPIDVVKVLLPAVVAFIIGILSTPVLTHYLYTYKMWKKSSVRLSIDGRAAPISSQLHNDEERKTPRMGGIVIWGSTILTALVFWLIAFLTGAETAVKLEFISRNQTWLLLFTLLAGGLFGLIDDYLVCRESGTYAGGGLSLRARLLFVAILGLFGAYWFHWQLGMSAIDIPFWGPLELGIGFVLVYLIFFIGIYSGGIIDGVDGLSGGIFASIFAALAAIAFSNNQINIAAFCSAIVGASLAFLWFNIPPARFFNSETGTMALTTTLVATAFLANAAIVMLVIALPLIVTSASSLIQILSKRLRGGKKVFIVAPLHNHFQAIGWPATKVTMRYWVISAVLSVLGVILHLVGYVG